MFRSATVRLTLWYVAMIMALSLIFSIAIYTTVSHELRESLRRQAVIFRHFPTIEGLPERPEFTQLPEDQFLVSRQRLAIDLALVNLSVLVVSGVASTFLARRTLRPIEDALEAQRRFTTDASHELRTPLAAMKAEIEVALRDREMSASDARKTMQSNLEEIGKLEALSSHLITLAQLEDHVAPIEMKVVDLSTTINASLARLAPLVKQRTMRINVDIPKISVQGDETRLAELFIILIDNAIKYSRPNQEINITARTEERTAIIEVKDHGKGIASEDLPHVFDRFYRADTSRTRSDHSGFGLGLAIARRIVGQHHGKITVRSTVGEGSTFTVSLPLANQSSPHA